MFILLGFPEIARKQHFYLDTRDKQKIAEKKLDGKGIRVIPYISKKKNYWEIFVGRETAHCGLFLDEGQMEFR